MRQQLARETVNLAMHAGASAAEVMVREGAEFSTSVRMGSVEKLFEANFRQLGVRVFHGNKTAVSATSDFSSSALRSLIQDALSMARAAGQDADAGLPSRELYDRNGNSGLALCFPAAQQLPPDEKISRARRCEEASLRFDPRINNSEGASFSNSVTNITYANSIGIFDSYSRSLATILACPLAELHGNKQRDYWLSTGLDASKLQSPEDVGEEAARRTLRRLGARKVATCEAPVLFDPRAAASLLSHVADAVCGTALLRKASFLLDKLGTRVASPEVTIIDDALLPGGLGSRPFDSEGIPSRATPVIEEGILRNYLLDSYSARKLGLQPTGNSTRQVSGAPMAGPSNFYLKPGKVSPEDIIASIKSGLYVTELIGFGVNIVSGNYSQGAAGIWIENGRLAYPVEEITIAGNLKDMLLSIEAVGNDLQLLSEIFAPSLKIRKMVVSGN
jgi:PmbA protein